MSDDESPPFKSMRLVAEPHENIGGARAILPSGRFRLALLGKLASCHWLCLMGFFPVVWREEKGKKKLFLPNASSLLHPLSSMCPLCYSTFQELH